jgi:transcriptional regulator with XRE-family HTH domain/molybdate-binding protein
VAHVEVKAVGRRLRDLREAAGLSQVELAGRAGVSRQAVGALEAGRHLPRVDAAVGLASALGTTVEDLLAVDAPRAVSVLGETLAEGQPVRAARVGTRAICIPLPSSADGESWHAPDAVIQDARVEPFPGASLEGFVVLGCDPALGVLAELGPSDIGRILAVPANSSLAREALLDGRAHAALVHDLDPSGVGISEAVATADVRRIHVATWRTGLAAPPGADGSIAGALAGRGTVIQRAAGAGAQAAYLRALAHAGAPTPAGPRASGHLDAGRRAMESGLASVTIEPVAVALGLTFHPLETHRVELWIGAEASEHPGALALRELLVSARFRDRVRRFAGYHLQDAA